LLSNGASRIVSPYARTDWPGVVELLRAHGPAEIIRRVRQAEADTSGDPGAQVPDDATIAHGTRLEKLRDQRRNSVARRHHRCELDVAAAQLGEFVAAMRTILGSTPRD